jgi:ATP-dependent RNA helicase HelY
MQCHLGDFTEYHGLIAALREIEGTKYRPERRSGQEVLDAIARFQPGDVFELGRGKRRGRYAVIDVSQKRSERRPKVLVLGEDRSLVRFSPSDFTEVPVTIGRLRRIGDARDLKARRQMSKELAGLQPDRPRRREHAGDFHDLDESARLRDEIAAHPCNECPELKRHLHYADRAARLERDIAGIERRVSRRTGTLSRRFARVLKVLEELGYVESWTLTEKGETLTRVYNESDLLVVEAVEEGLFDELDHAEIAAVFSTLVYESRGPEAPVLSELPTTTSSEVFRKLMRLWRKIKRQEEASGLDLTREPDAGFAAKAYRWAKGMDLSRVLDEDDAPGDFVRSMKQLIDLLRQIEEISVNGTLGARVRETIESVQRGVIAYTSLEL